VTCEERRFLKGADLRFPYGLDTPFNRFVNLLFGYLRPTRCMVALEALPVETLLVISTLNSARQCRVVSSDSECW
jgi:hypothetical protein